MLLSADGDISVFAVPDEVADHLEKYCMEFCCDWLPKSPDAEKYRVQLDGMVGMCYNEKDFIEYLNGYIFDQKSALIATFTGIYSKNELPEEYIQLPYFAF